jgi:membrane associated rhomboid family serine protease
MADSSAPPPLPPPPPTDIGEGLRRVQQMLLGAGYLYAEGNADRWPMTPVRLARGKDSLFVLPWAPGHEGQIARVWEQVRRSTSGSAGVLLVGGADVDDPGVAAFFNATRGTAAYLDFRRGRSRLRRKWAFGDKLRPLREGNLKKFFDPREAAPFASIDCPARLRLLEQRRSQAEDFFSQAQAVQGGGGAWGTWAIAAACAGLFAAMVLASRSAKALETPDGELLLKWGALYGPLVRSGQWWRIFTCWSVHVGVIHLAFNVYALVIFGRNLERLQGTWRLLVFFFLSAACGAVARLWWGPMILSAGASGGIFGLMGALLAVVLRHHKEFPAFLSSAYRRWVLNILLYNGVFLFMPQIDGVAHVGGFLGGFAAALVLSRSPVRAAWPAGWTWPALGAMVLAGCLLAQHAIRRIPAENQPQAEMRQFAARAVTLAEFAQLLESSGQVLDDWDAAFNSAAQSAPGRQGLLDLLQREVLPSIREPNTLGKLQSLAVRIPSKEPLPALLQRLLDAREQYCEAAATAIEDPSRPHSVSFAEARINLQRAGLELAKALSRARSELTSSQRPGR